MSGTSTRHGLENMDFPLKLSSKSYESTMRDANTERSLQDMPQEILSQVFSYLPIAHRKHIRLMCHSFYEACHTFQIENSEEMAFYGNINTKAAILSLYNSERKFWNIKFNEVKLDSSFLSFFSEHGARIYSLILYNCSLAKGVLHDIIKLCRLNLRSCAFIYSIPEDNHIRKYNVSEHNIYNLLLDFTILCDEGIICTQVTDFTLVLYLPPANPISSFLSNEKLLHIFNIFPNIKELDLRIYVDIDCNLVSFIDVPGVNSEKVLDYSCIYNQVMKMSHQLEKLCLHFRYSDQYSFLSSDTWDKICNIKSNKLKQLSLNLILPRFHNIFVTYPLLKLKNLSTFDCRVNYNNDNDWLYDTDDDDSDEYGSISSDNILLILNSAPNLRYLTIRFCNFEFDPRVRINMECFEALVKSKLIVLEMRQNDNYGPSLLCDFENSALNKSLSPNHSLKQIQATLVDDNTISLFSSYFQNLEHLQLLEAGDDNILNILANQTQLKSLSLGMYNGLLLTFPYQHKDVSTWHQLDNLTHLRIVLRVDRNSDLAVLMLSKIRLPKLESLSIERDSNMSMHTPKENEFELIWQAIKTFTQLEYLSIALHYKIQFHQWLTLFQALPKLRHFHMWAIGRFDRCVPRISNLEYELANTLGINDSKCRQVFNLYPSLRTIIIAFDASPYNGVRYFKDITINDVICKWLQLPQSDKFEGEGIPYYYYDIVPNYVEQRKTRLFK